MLIDSHIHLDSPEFDPDRLELIAAARAAGVGLFVVPGVSRDQFDAVEALARTHADVAFALGIHPLYVNHAQSDDLDELDHRLAQGRAVAVGEIGLDQFVSDPPLDLQIHFFASQLKLARKRALPVILHVRRAVDEVLKQLRRIEVPGGIVHAFNGSLQQANQLIAMGFKLGFGGAMTYEGSKRIRMLASTLPLNAIVLETDAPDMSPSWRPRARTEPVDLIRIASACASLRGIAVSDLVEASSANVGAVFHCPQLQRAS